jgi:predicted RNA-binding protein with RPS1 domain
VSVGQRVKVKVLEVDEEREKVSLTMKDWSDAWSQKVRNVVLEEKKRDMWWSKAWNDDEMPETSMKGNISFS